MVTTPVHHATGAFRKGVEEAPRMRRAAFIGSTAAAAASLPLGAFAQTIPGPPAPPLRRLVPVRVAADAVTRTTVGLRPYRAAGFVLRAESDDRKTYIHNYGHGGGGMSLSWGSALVVRELATATRHRTAAVIGCGVNGLSSALALLDAGFDVTIYARELPPDTTSNKSGAQWSPSSIFDPDRVDPSFRALYTRVSELSYARFQTLLGEDYGVRWIENFDCNDRADAGFFQSVERRWIMHLYPQLQRFGPGEHPFPTTYATRFLTMLIEPNRYLRALTRDVLARRARIVVRELASRAELAALAEPLVVNCSGLGARVLAGDAALDPVRGQLDVLRPDPAIDYTALYGGGGYMFPRSDGIVLGGTFQHGNSDLNPDPASSARIVGSAARFFGAMRAG
jgi:D-amino-acid oxidase